MTDPRQPIAVAVREAVRAAHNRGLTPVDVAKLDAFCDDIGVPRSTSGPAVSASEPPWLTTARSLIGTRETVGPQHNSWIAKGWARLGAGWFSDDETPWCGFFVAHCIEAAGLPIPAKGEFARALCWASYGVACTPRVGAIGVKKRDGGNHVFFIVGETPDKRFFKCLGGNQGNCVCIIDIEKSDVFAIRWPAGVLQHDLPLPRMAAGKVSSNEA